ncbi:MAG: GNAT family N-acetyltransferase [Sideroxydans sp.]|nr:GNAT family N-acetyltransferase [Sideroxydans sp.]
MAGTQSSAAVAFRRATPADADAIVALVNSAYRGDSSRAGWTTEADLLGGQRTDIGEVARLLGMADSLFLLGLSAGEIIGSVHLQRLGVATAGLGMLVIRPTLQGWGFGTQLMRAAETWGSEAWHAARMQMQVITLRTELIDYYLRRGYRRTGELRPFPAEPEFGLPKVAGLQFEVLEKTLG